MKRILALPLCAVFCAMACACSSAPAPSSDGTVRTREDNGRELFLSDSLNAYYLYRTYPVPDPLVVTPAPKGYRPVYISSYARHGSRQIEPFQSGPVREVLARADEAGCLSDLGREVLAKVSVLDDDLHITHAELTEAGVEQHKGIARRMYDNYPNVFSAKGTPVRLYSTVTQRTMLSMFACNETLLKLNPSIACTRQASDALTYLVRHVRYPEGIPPYMTAEEFIRRYFDARSGLGKIFTPDAPALRDTASFVSGLYDCGSIMLGIYGRDMEFLRSVFSRDELFLLQQSKNYPAYMGNSDSPVRGPYILDGIRPLLKDFLDKADAALEKDIPGADLRFGHDSYLISLCALIGVDGYVRQETDPLKVIDTFQDFRVAPMAGNLQLVFFRNREGDVLVKFLHNEVETFIPIGTDIYPFYHWDDVRAFFVSKL